MRRAIFLCSILAGLAACGGSSNGSPDAGCSDGAACGTDCTAAFTGNFADHSSGATDCAQVMPGTGSASSDVVLGFQLAAPALAGPVAVTIDLGTSPSTGMTSSEAIPTWSALGLRATSTGQCVYSAGATAVPTGAFALDLQAIDAAAGTAHGTLTITQWVQAPPEIDCGSGDTEQVDVTF